MTNESDFSASDPPEVKLRKQLQFFVRIERHSGLDEDLVREKLRLRLRVEEERILRRRRRKMIFAGVAAVICLGGFAMAVTERLPLCLIGGFASLLASLAATVAIADLITAAKQLIELDQLADEEGVSK